jgi:hypothetical protein
MRRDVWVFALGSLFGSLLSLIAWSWLTSIQR